MNSKLFAKYCIEKLDLNNTKLGNEYYYNSLPLCIIDTVFSIGIKYVATQNVVKRFCEYFGIKEFRDYGSSYANRNEQYSINEFIEIYNDNDMQFITEVIFKNKCRTSPSNGILKSEAVLKYAQVLQKYKINHFQDINLVLPNIKFEKEIKKIKGQSGVSLPYFLMLTGDENFIKPDRMIKRFANKAITEKLSIKNLEKLIKDAFRILEIDFPELTLRSLDHEIWKYQKNA